MPSYGEARIMLGSYIIGDVRVDAIYSASGVYPRLGLRLSITLRDGPDDSACPGTFTLIGITGELRLVRDSDAFGVLHWIKQQEVLRSSVQGSENQVELICELDPWRLEHIERHRGGGEFVMWMQLWLRALGEKSYVKMDVDVFQLCPPRDRWLEFLNNARKCVLEVIEVSYPDLKAGVFHAALQHTHKARKLIDTGQYNEALACCRRAIEALEHELPPSTENVVLEVLKTSTNDRSAKEYSGIVSKIKQLAGMAIHDYGKEISFSRAEACFLVGVTERVIVLIGKLISGP